MLGYPDQTELPYGRQRNQEGERVPQLSHRLLIVEVGCLCPVQAKEPMVGHCGSGTPLHLALPYRKFMNDTGGLSELALVVRCCRHRYWQAVSCM